MYRGFISPSNIYLMDVINDTNKVLEKSPIAFDNSNLSHEYHYATAPDGTKIPYQVVGPKNRDPNKTYPTIMYVYGAYGVARTAWYRQDIGTEWLTEGGVYVIANVRGGGEYGVPWHQAAVRTKKHQTIDDMATVARDLIKNKVTSEKQLGVYGASVGGLAACAMVTSYPELINASICFAPLTDLMRYTKLFAGDSWMAELGDPEDENEKGALLKLSPFHAIKKDNNLPAPLLITHKSDDRMHPGHARRMVAKMQEQGYEAFYYESKEGGHTGGSGPEEKAKIRAMEYEYFRQRLSTQK